MLWEMFWVKEYFLLMIVIIECISLGYSIKNLYAVFHITKSFVDKGYDWILNNSNNNILIGVLKTYDEKDDIAKAVIKATVHTQQRFFKVIIGAIISLIVPICHLFYGWFPEETLMYLNNTFIVSIITGFLAIVIALLVKWYYKMQLVANAIDIYEAKNGNKKKMMLWKGKDVITVYCE